jgi:hypothetical protein
VSPYAVPDDSSAPLSLLSPNAVTRPALNFSRSPVSTLRANLQVAAKVCFRGESRVAPSFHQRPICTPAHSISQTAAPALCDGRRHLFLYIGACTTVPTTPRCSAAVVRRRSPCWLLVTSRCAPHYHATNPSTAQHFALCKSATDILPQTFREPQPRATGSLRHTLPPE